MTDQLMAYAAEVARDQGMPKTWAWRVGEDAVDAAFSAIETAVLEDRWACLWPQPCRCWSGRVSEDCDYHEEHVHGRVLGGQSMDEWHYVPSWEDADGRSWRVTSWLRERLERERATAP